MESLANLCCCLNYGHRAFFIKPLQRFNLVNGYVNLDFSLWCIRKFLKACQEFSLLPQLSHSFNAVNSVAQN